MSFIPCDVISLFLMHGVYFNLLLQFLFAFFFNAQSFYFEVFYLNFFLLLLILGGRWSTSILLCWKECLPLFKRHMAMNRPLLNYKIVVDVVNVLNRIVIEGKGYFGIHFDEVNVEIKHIQKKNYPK